jgi:hypothetical protein
VILGMAILIGHRYLVVKVASLHDGGIARLKGDTHAFHAAP